MTLHFGTVHYFDEDALEHPDIVVGVLRTLADYGNGSRSQFQGIFPNTGTWSRKKEITERSLQQLAVDVTGGVYASVIASFGDDNAGASVSISCKPEEETWPIPFSIIFTAALPSHGVVAQADQVSHQLWSICRAVHGITVLGVRAHEVSAELSTIPHNVWGEEEDPRDEQRLLRLQELRAQFGETVRGAGWGNYLGDSLVRKLGGLELLEREAPVARVERLPAGGAYLRLSDQPLLLKTVEFQDARIRLERFMAPVLADQLAPPSASAG